MKRIGIVTLYYKSNNYGANLQAFALAKYISNLDNCIAEQISVCFQGYEKKAKDTTASQTRLNKLVQMSRHPLICCKKIVRVIARQFSPNRINEIVKKIIKKLNKKNFDKRTSAVIDFNQNIIPHSKKVYTENNIGECGTNYDIFITGSDQVWSWCSNTFLLSFVEGKKKFSYAASISRIEISENHKQFIKDRIKDYDAISVRDETDKRIVSELTQKNVEVVLDPAFLIDREGWDKIIPKNRKYKEKYIFCYFLGDSKEIKKMVTEFAHLKHLKIMTIAHFLDSENQIVWNDFLFGDIKPYDVSPADFISLIRDAEYVCTDSFHGLVFSLIYHKEFFSFDRISKWGKMSSRITNLLDKFDLLDRFCCEENQLRVEYIARLTEIDYDKIEAILGVEKAKSQKFINDHI